jgi:hypothetical protein
MKTTQRFLTTLSIAGFALVAVMFSSCGKEDLANQSYYAPAAEQTPKQRFEALMAELPEIALWDERTEQIVRINMNTRDFSFSDPNPGWNFSSSNGPQFVEAEEGGGILIIPAFSFGGNTGGTVVAGSTALDINYTFCFAASDEALGLDLFDFGGNFDGVSIVLGIAGDFEALADGTAEEGDEFDSFFQGLAMYIVYDNEASGSYEILNWIEEIDGDPDDFVDQGFSYVVDFQNFNLYFSANGDLNVSGGEMSFNGEYLGFQELFESLDEEDDEEIDFALVPGFGTMGCN